MKNYLLLLIILLIPARMFPQQPCGVDSIAVIKELTVGETKTGDIWTDLKTDLTVPPGGGLNYDPDTGTLIITDADGNVVGTIELPPEIVDRLNNGESFTYTVQDGNGNIYTLTSDGEGNTSVEQTGSTGNGGSDSGQYDPNTVNSQDAVVIFSKGSGKYAFDEWIDGYEQALLIKNKYENLSGYYVPCKLIPPGRTDKVAFEVKQIGKETIDESKIIFRSGTGIEYVAKDGEISITGGRENDAQDIYALYPDGADKFKTLGKLKVLSYKELNLNVKIVPVNGNTIDEKSAESYLNEVYGKSGIRWTVSKDENFGYPNEDLQSEGSGFFSRYTDEMKALNAAYKLQRGTDNQTVYLFVLNTGNVKGYDLAGDMPRGGQFGYIFKSSGNINRTIAHELGHGKLKLRHTFDNDYGKLVTTDNLMDYGTGTHLAKWQWDAMFDPALIINPFEGDEEGMSLTSEKEQLKQILQKIKANQFVLGFKCPSTYKGQEGYTFTFQNHTLVGGSYTPDKGLEGVLKLETILIQDVLHKESDLNKKITELINNNKEAFLVIVKNNNLYICYPDNKFSNYCNTNNFIQNENFIAEVNSSLKKCVSQSPDLYDEKYNFSNATLPSIEEIKRELETTLNNSYMQQRAKIEIKFHTSNNEEFTISTSGTNGTPDATLDYYLDYETQNIHVLRDISPNLLSIPPAASITEKVREYAVSMDELRSESLKAVELLKEDEQHYSRGFLNSIKDFFSTRTAAVQVTVDAAKSIWERGNIQEAGWYNESQGYKEFYQPRNLTVSQIPAGVVDGMLEEVLGIPILIKTTGEILLDKEKKSAFGSVFTSEGLEKMWEGIKEEFTNPNRQEYTITKTAVNTFYIAAGIGGIIATKTVQKAGSKTGKELAEDVGKTVDEFPGWANIEKAYKKLSKETVKQLQDILSSFDQKVIEKAFRFVPINEVEIVVRRIGKFKNCSGIDKILQDMGESFNKWTGARFVLEFAERFPVSNVAFEVVVEGIEGLRRYDLVVNTIRYELKSWSKWMPWSDKIILDQLVKDLSKVTDLDKLQWIFRKTEGITDDMLKQNLKKALTSSQGIDALNQIPEGKLTKLFDLAEKEVLNAHKIEKFIDENFDVIFKVVE